MSSQRASSAATTGHVGPQVVVAGLSADQTAEGVAQAAVELARRIGAGVRFIHVSAPGTPPDARATAESATFDAAIRAVQVHERVPTTFESATGRPTEVLVERSEAARALVLGERSPHPDGLLGPTAAYCARHARCPVHLVALTGSGRDLRPLAGTGHGPMLEGQAMDH